MKTRLMMFVAVIALFVFIIQKKTGRKPMKSSKLLLVTVMRSSVPN